QPARRWRSTNFIVVFLTTSEYIPKRIREFHARASGGTPRRRPGLGRTHRAPAGAAEGGVTADWWRTHTGPVAPLSRVISIRSAVLARGGTVMAKFHARPSNQYRYEHYDPWF